MGVDRGSGGADEPDDADQGKEEPTRPESQPSPSQPGEVGYPSRADARRAAMGAGQNAAATTAEAIGGSSPANGGLKSTQEAPRQGEQGGQSRDAPSQEDGKESDTAPEGG